MTIDLEDSFLNTPMGQKEYTRKNKDKKEEENENEEEEALNKSGDYKNCLKE